MNYRFQFRDEELEAAIENTASRQRDVAVHYARCMSSLALSAPRILPEWGYINGRILARWPSGLERVKKMAWDILAGKAPSRRRTKA